jgi:hypothetical protein
MTEEEMKTKIENQANHIRRMEILIQQHKAELTKCYGIFVQKNKELDALHYVWCDGGCDGGVHRYENMNKVPLTKEVVRLAEANIFRLTTWFINHEFKKKNLSYKERYHKTLRYWFKYKILRKLYLYL